MEINLLECIDEDDDHVPCKGLFFRCEVSSYVSGTTIGTHKKLRLLKRKSCKGCSQCDFVWEVITEDATAYFGSEDYLFGLENGKIYRPNVITSQGYFDLYPEVDGLEFVEVKDQKES